MNEIVKKNGITYGGYAAAIFVSLLIVMYVVDLSLFTKWYMGTFQFIAIITLGVLAVKKSKTEMSNFISFKDAFTTYFVMIVIGLVVYSLAIILLFNYIDPQAKEVVMEHFMQYTKEMLEKFNSPASVIKETLKEMKKNDSFSVSNQAISLVFSILFYSVIGLIIAAIFKSKPQDNY